MLRSATIHLLPICTLLVWSADAFALNRRLAFNVQGAVAPAPVTGSSSWAASFRSETRLHAKKKRRRKDESDESSDLPEFELIEDIELVEANTPTVKKKASSSSSVSSASSLDGSLEVTPAMMSRSSSIQPTKSVRELITDRSLEKKLQFDEEDVVTDPSGAAIPDLVELARQQRQQTQQSSSSDPSEMSKRARQAARRAELASQSAQEEEESNLAENVLSKLPIQVTNEEGKVEPIKLLEAGTWLGIFLLVAWELYLNSPFFERAAPMAPVVYTFFM